MGELDIKPIALLISFIIWLDIDITVCVGFAKNNFKKKSEKFREKAKVKGNYVQGYEVKSKYYDSWQSESGKRYEEKYKVIYEYMVNGKKYKKKLYYKNSRYPRQINIYYKEKNPRYSIAENESKKGIIYTMLQLCIPFSVFIGIPLLALGISKLITIF